MPPGVVVDYGLSPPVRGNQNAKLDDQRQARSIPACAGEPDRHDDFTTLAMVYPRLCGGTHTPRSRLAGVLGLSPPVRGNPLPEESSELRQRSIPACAGEPAPPFP